MGQIFELYRKMPNVIIRKVSDENGRLGNMAPSPIIFDGLFWSTAEALFQSMRFDCVDIKEEIRHKNSPMSAKMVAKKHKSKMIVTPMSDIDVTNMKKCLTLKFYQNEHLRIQLKTLVMDS